MTLQIDHSGGQVILTLNGEPSVSGVKELHASLVAHLTPESKVLLNASHLRRVDAAVLQLLHAVARYVRTFDVTESSPELTLALQLVGLDKPVEAPPGGAARLPTSEVARRRA